MVTTEKKMHTPYDYCPKCQGLRRINRYLGLETVSSPQGKVDLLLYCFYCESCNTFIRSAPVLENKTAKSDAHVALQH